MTRGITSSIDSSEHKHLVDEPGSVVLDDTDWTYVESMTPDEARQNALDDPDSQPLTPDLRARLRRAPDPQAIRLRLGLSQEAFARRFEIALGVLQEWEQGVRIPDSTARAYLRVIDRIPEAVTAALAPSPESRRNHSNQ